MPQQHSLPSALPVPDPGHAPVVVVGLGNPLLRDEGIGIRLLHELEDRAKEFPRCEFLDLGTGGLELLHAMRGRRNAVLIDCAFMGAEPGDMKRFTPNEVRSHKPAGTSAHQLDVLHLLDLLEALNEAPDAVVIYGIEPRDIAPGTELSPQLECRLPEYAAALERELRALEKQCTNSP